MKLEQSKMNFASEKKKFQKHLSCSKNVTEKFMKHIPKNEEEISKKKRERNTESSKI